MPLDDLIAEARRQIEICNACRYCEGYCAVFPALERRLSFDEGDIHYLANLCHNCGACLYACQYAPPHEFQLNFPRMLAQVRRQTYEKYAWPGFLASAFGRNGTVVAIVAALAVALLFAITAGVADPQAFFAAHSDREGSFYAVMPHETMTAIFGAVFLFVVLALAMGVARFWLGTGESLADFAAPQPLSSAAWDAAVLRNLDAGPRRTFHHLTFYGFLLCFAATAVGTIYHYVFDIRAPYPLWSLPVMLGTLGGIGLIVGPVGLMRLRRRRDPDLTDRAQSGMDAAFLVLLLLLGATGLALLAFRETRAMGTLLALHLGVVLAFFATLPYGKFVHAPYRLAALARFHLERRRPLPSIGPE